MCTGIEAIENVCVEVACSLQDLWKAGTREGAMAIGVVGHIALTVVANDEGEIVFYQADPNIKNSRR